MKRSDPVRGHSAEAPQTFRGRSADIPRTLYCPACGQGVPGLEFLMDATTRTVSTKAGRVELTSRQFAVAAELLRAYPHPIHHDRLYERVFLDARGEGPDPRIAKTIVSQLRKLIGPLGFAIRATYGHGYVIACEPAPLEQAMRRRRRPERAM